LKMAKKISIEEKAFKEGYRALGKLYKKLGYENTEHGMAGMNAALGDLRRQREEVFKKNG